MRTTNRPILPVLSLSALLACGPAPAGDATTDAPPTRDPDAPDALCPDVLDPSHVHAQARVADAGNMFVDLDAPEIMCANVGPSAKVFGGTPSLTIDPSDGALYYVDRDEPINSPTAVMRVLFDPLVWSTELSSGEWSVPDSALDGDEVVANLDAATCGDVARPRLVFHGPTDQIGVVCDGVASGLALIAFDGTILEQWGVESYTALQFAADGRVVFESTIGDIFVADAGAIDNPSRVDWHSADETPFVRTVRIVAEDVVAVGVGSQGELRRYRRQGAYFELDAELGDVGLGPLDVDEAPELSILIEASGDVVVHAWTPPGLDEFGEPSLEVRARVQRFSAGGAQVLFDTLVDGHEDSGESSGGEVPPLEVSLVDVFVAG